MISIAARTTYPLITPAPRVRIAGFIAPLAANDVDLRFLPSLTADEYRVLASGASRVRKLGVVTSAGLRAARARPEATLTMVHRLLFITPIPGVDPPSNLDLYDFDDALYLGSLGRSNLAAGPLKREASRWKTCVRRARMVIAGNSHLAAAARRETSGPMEVIPSCVDPSVYQIRQHEDGERLTVGWIGSASTSHYLKDVLGAFERVNRDSCEVRLVVVGGRVEHSAPWLESRPWSLRREAMDIADFDIGIMPLPDDEWARGKCGYKLLQYFAAGVPAIASPVGLAPHLIGDERGLLASTEDEWVAAIRQLAASHTVRRQMGANGRTFAERDYSFERWAPELATLVAGLV